MENIENKIYDLENEIAVIEDKIEYFELDPYDYEDEYCDSLDCEGPVNVCGIDFNPSDVLREMDPAAYRCALLDYVDGKDILDSEEYQELIENRDALEEELETLQAELEDEDDN